MVKTIKQCPLGSFDYVSPTIKLPKYFTFKELIVLLAYKNKRLDEPRVPHPPFRRCRSVTQRDVRTGEDGQTGWGQGRYEDSTNRDEITVTVRERTFEG